MDVISIRTATKADVNGIYDLLAAEGSWQSVEDICMRLDNYTLLLCDNHMAAVIVGVADGNNKRLTINVHPGYPERIIADSIRRLLEGTACRKAALKSKMKYLGKDISQHKSTSSETFHVHCRKCENATVENHCLKASSDI